MSLKIGLEWPTSRHIRKSARQTDRKENEKAIWASKQKGQVTYIKRHQTFDNIYLPVKLKLNNDYKEYSYILALFPLIYIYF